MSVPKEDIWLFRLVMIGVVAVVWFFLSLYLGMMYISIPDTTDTTTRDPLWLTVVVAVMFFPVDLITLLIPDTHLSDWAGAGLFLIGTAISSLFWAALLYLSFGRVRRIVRGKF